MKLGSDGTLFENLDNLCWTTPQDLCSKAVVGTTRVITHGLQLVEDQLNVQIHGALLLLEACKMVVVDLVYVTSGFVEKEKQRERRRKRRE